MTILTKRQSEILNLIQSHLVEFGSPPTRAEIANIMGFKSPNAAEDHLRALAKKGVIELIPGTSRGIRLNNYAGGLPIIGKVTPGCPMMAKENIENTYRMEQNIFNPSANYLLRMCGNSMMGAGILDGDLLAVHSTSQAHEGQIVVARINDEVIIKRCKKNGDTMMLAAENPSFTDTITNLKQPGVKIEGIGVGIIRRY